MARKLELPSYCTLRPVNAHPGDMSFHFVFRHGSREFVSDLYNPQQSETQAGCAKRILRRMGWDKKNPAQG